MNADVKVQGVVYRPQFRKCGKPGCKCTTGKGHGPYWYKYDGNGPAQYVGKELPVSIKNYEQVLKQSMKKIREVESKLEKRRDDAYEIYSQAQAELQTLQALKARGHVDARALEKLGLSALVLKGA